MQEIKQIQYITGKKKYIYIYKGSGLRHNIQGNQGHAEHTKGCVTLKTFNFSFT